MSCCCMPSTYHSCCSINILGVSGYLTDSYHQKKKKWKCNILVIKPLSTHAAWHAIPHTLLQPFQTTAIPKHTKMVQVSVPLFVHIMCPFHLLLLINSYSFFQSQFKYQPLCEAFSDLSSLDEPHLFLHSIFFMLFPPVLWSQSHCVHWQP